MRVRWFSSYSAEEAEVGTSTAELVISDASADHFVITHQVSGAFYDKILKMVKNLKSIQTLILLVSR